jgi:hypothetical protein
MTDIDDTLIAAQKKINSLEDAIRDALVVLSYYHCGGLPTTNVRTLAANGLASRLLKHMPDFDASKELYKAHNTPPCHSCGGLLECKEDCPNHAG